MILHKMSLILSFGSQILYVKISKIILFDFYSSKDPMLFPLPKLLLCIAKDEKSSRRTLKLIKPLLEKMRDNEYVKRTMISDLGVKTTERINLKESKKQTEEDEYECEMCSANLYVSFVSFIFTLNLVKNRRSLFF